MIGGEHWNWSPLSQVANPGPGITGPGVITISNNGLINKLQFPVGLPVVGKVGSSTSGRGTRGLRSQGNLSLHSSAD